MSLVYRAIWQDDRPALCHCALTHLRIWIDSKYDGELEVPDSGTSEATISGGGPWVDVDLRVESATSDDGALCAMRATLGEGHAEEQWRTTLRAWQDARTGEGFVWVDLTVVGTDIDLRTVAPAAPRLVRQMLAEAHNPRVEGQPIWQAPTAFTGPDGGEELAELVSTFDRTLPIVVFSRNDRRYRELHRDMHSFDELVRAAASQVAGIANIAVLDEPGADAFTQALDRTHGVWDGAFRVYLRNLDPALADDAWRHRYVTAERYMGGYRTAGGIIARQLSTVSPTRRPPESFTRAQRLLHMARGGHGDYEQLEAYADEEIERLTREIVDLRTQLQQRDEDIRTSEDGYLRALIQLDDASNTIDDLRWRLRIHEASHAQPDIPANPAENIPTSAANVSDAIAKAHLYLADRVIIAPKAAKDKEVGKLDSLVNNGSLGRQMWRGFRALHAYATALAAEEDTADFWTWCATSQHPWAWPATSKRLAMSESDSVENRRKYKHQRMRPVAAEVESSERIYMPAHLKITEGGGDLACRVYFHIDQERAKVHIGFIGTHAHMGNTKG